MSPSIFNTAAQWVLQCHTVGTPPAATKNQIAESLASLYSSAGKCEACIMVPDLFPGSTLEAIYLPKLGLTRATRQADTVLTGHVVTPAALAAIGNALTTYLHQSGNDMAHYEFDDGAQAVVYLPSERRTILQALGLTLLET